MISIQKDQLRYRLEKTSSLGETKKIVFEPKGFNFRPFSLRKTWNYFNCPLPTILTIPILTKFS